MLTKLVFFLMLATVSAGDSDKTTPIALAHLFPETSLDLEFLVPARYVSFKPGFGSVPSVWLCSPADAEAITKSQRGNAATLPCLYMFADPKERFDPSTNTFSFETELPSGKKAAELDVAVVKRVAHGIPLAEITMTINGVRQHGLAVADGTKVYHIRYAPPNPYAGDDSIWQTLIDSL